VPRRPPQIARVPTADDASAPERNPERSSEQTTDGPPNAPPNAPPNDLPTRPLGTGFDEPRVPRGCHPLVFGVVMATIQFAITIYFMQTC
jgi:hypothetical protein